MMLLSNHQSSFGKKKKKKTADTRSTESGIWLAELAALEK